MPDDPSGKWMHRKQEWFTPEQAKVIQDLEFTLRNRHQRRVYRWLVTHKGIVSAAYNKATTSYQPGA
jgi:hypothetical protein